MPQLIESPRPARSRNLLYFSRPSLWPTWPFLPVICRPPGASEQQLGMLYDARTVSGSYGYSATVFLTNLFQLPSTEARFVELPKRVYDTVEEMADAGWTVD